MIQLSAAVRQNLNSLQSTAMMMSQTQNRLATGLKVTSALDNPNSYFTAENLNNRSSDMSALLDDMGQGIQTLKAADEGITSVAKLVEAARAKANQAQQTSSVSARRQFATEYNEILTQIEGIAQDAGYNGKNLIGGTSENLTVKFNENGTNDITINAVDYTDSDTGLGMPDLATGTISTGTVTESDLLAGAEAGDTLTLTIGSKTHTIEYGAGATVAEVIAALNAIPDVEASTDATTVTIKVAGANFTLDDTDTTANLATITGTGHVASDFDTDSQIQTTLTDLTDALSSLRSQASTFGTNLTVVENRQRFTNAMISTLQEGAGKLVLADTNQEGANLLALQTRQQLASTSLSFASQADQNVLRLF